MILACTCSDENLCQGCGRVSICWLEDFCSMECKALSASQRGAFTRLLAQYFARKGPYREGRGRKAA